MKLLIMLFSPVYCYFSLSGTNIPLNTLFSNTLTLRSSLNVSDQVSHPYRTTGNLRVPYVCGFSYQCSNCYSSTHCLYRTWGSIEQMSRVNRGSLLHLVHGSAPKHDGRILFWSSRVCKACQLLITQLEVRFCYCHLVLNLGVMNFGDCL